MKTEKTLATVKERLAKAQLAAEGRLEIWKEKLAASPWDALVWGEDAFQAVANQRTCAYLLRILDTRPELTLAVMRESCQKELSTAVSNVLGHGSMETRNLMHKAELVAWRWIVEEVLS